MVPERVMDSRLGIGGPASQFRAGEVRSVQVARVDLEARRIDFRLVRGVDRKSLLAAAPPRTAKATRVAQKPIGHQCIALYLIGQSGASRAVMASGLSQKTGMPFFRG